MSELPDFARNVDDPRGSGGGRPPSRHLGWHTFGIGLLAFAGIPTTFFGVSSLAWGFGLVKDDAQEDWSVLGLVFGLPLTFVGLGLLTAAWTWRSIVGRPRAARGGSPGSG